MAYQNVSTPKFYINTPEWLNATGAISLAHEQLRTLPVNPTYRSDINLSLQGMTENGFVAVLGHDFGSAVNTYQIQESGTPIILNNIVNGTDGATYSTPPDDGFSISTFTGSNDITKYALSAPASNTGSVVIGNFYTMPNAPNLSLTMSREYGGTKEFTTINGSSLSNTMWSKPPAWGSLGAWELHDPSTDSPNTQLSRSGRRTWNLKFSYMDDGNLWGSNQLLSKSIGNTLSESAIDLYDGTIPSGDLYNDTELQYNLLTDDNFFSQVWHKTLGGTLPFIFQSDKDNNNPDQFAICKFKENSLKATQTAVNVYDISLSIEEVW